MNIGEKIRHIRELKGLSQENLAKELEMSITAYGDIERGRTSPDLDRLDQIAKKLGVTLKNLMSFEEQMNNFFENCANPSVQTTHSGDINIHKNEEKELKHLLNLERKEGEKKDLIIENLQTKVELLELKLKKQEQRV
jgi:transcriptional regulator with XRE-family HTH domain